MRKQILLAGLVAVIATLSSGAAQADASCDVLFKKIRFVGGEYQALWTTNYYTVVPSNPQAPHLLEGKMRFMAATELKVSVSMGEIFADGRRTMQFYRPNSSSKLPEVTEPIRIRIRPDGMAFFGTVGPYNPWYGPYNPWCAQDRYMIVLSGDSVEVVSFLVGPY